MPSGITRTELVWPGKYDEEGRRVEVERVSLPFQVIERVNESRASREAEKTRSPTLFDIWEGDSAETFEEGWRNKLIWGDNKLVMSSLLDQFAGKIDLIYIDPPFAVGADFSVSVPIGEGDEELAKEPSLIEEKAYRDTWGLGVGSYLTMMSERMQLMRELLSDLGSIYVHGDWRIVHFFGSLLREVFGGTFRNEIVWHYPNSGLKAKARKYHQVHDIILHFSKSEEFIWNEQREPLEVGAATRQPLRKFNSKTRKADVVRGPDGKILYKDVVDKLVTSVWRIPMLNIGDERVGYPTQKPEALLQRIISASSNEGDLVADFFLGSGTSAAVAEKMGRRWIGCDLGRFAVHTARKRLLGIPDCKPFEVLNLGKYERKYWAVATFGEDLDEDGLISLYEYVAFVLRLYGATPATGMQHLHGKLRNAFVHVGAVDSPVTIDEIVACVDESVALRAKELHILGWEWEMGLHDPISEDAKRRGVNLVLRQIPREVMEQEAAAKGDIDFFELAYLDIEVNTKKKRDYVVQLKNFAIPNPELVPDEARSKIKKWSDYVDYWAVDWNFSDDSFIQGWVTYRTRKNRSLELQSDSHTYDAPGEYSVMVKVIDIFGNDTSKIIRVTVS